MIDVKNKRKSQMFKSFAMIFGPGLIVVLALASMFISINIQNGKDILKIRQSNNAEIVSVNVNTIFDAINSDGNIILNSSEIKAYIGDSLNTTNRNELKRIFSNMMTNTKIYDAIQFINNDGHEDVRINYENNSLGAVADTDLQYQGDQDYFQEGLKLNKGEFYISPMELSIKNGEVEKPGKPIIRFVMPVFNENNQRQGVLVLNYLAQNFLNQIENDSKNALDTKILLLNDTGDYLISGDSDKNFSFMDENEEETSFSKDEPNIWQAILENKTGYFDDEKNIYYYTPVYPLSEYHNRYWLLVNSADLDQLGVLNNEDNRKIVMIAALLIFVLLIISLIVSWLLLLKKEAGSKEKIAENIFKNSNEGIMIMDSETKIIYVNRSFTKITGYLENEVIGKKPINFKNSENLKLIYSEIWQSVEDLGSWQGEIIDEKKDGTLYPKFITISKIFSSGSDKLINYLEVFEDLTSTRITEEAINKIKHYDEITGLPVHLLFEEKMKELIKQYDDITVVILQITNYNTLYDNLGKKYGVSVIKEVSHRIKTFLKEDDFLAKLDTDQFIIARINSKDKLEMDHFLNKLISFLNESIDIEDEKIYLNISIGLSIFQEHSSDIEKLTEFANIAKNYAIQTGDNTYVYYEKEIQTNYLNNLKLETHLRSALKKDELTLHFQPQVLVGSEEIIGTEALLRWHNHELGKVNPSQFISVAERTDLIIPIGNWVLEQAIKQNKKWLELTNKKLTVAVNLSPVQFKKSDLPAIIQDLLEKYEMPADLLEVEITEGILVENMENIRSDLEKIKNLGVKVAIDDFGTGYSSLKYLQNLNFNKLKIDREFIKDYPENDNGNIAVTIISLARQMGLKVLAEGAETLAQYQFLKEHGCDEIQGYYFYKPMTVDDFEKLITD